MQDKALERVIAELLKMRVVHEAGTQYANLAEHDFDEVEARVGVKLPRSYRELHMAIRQVQFGMWDLYRVMPARERERAQLANEPLWGPDDHTLENRKREGASFPEYLVAIAGDGLGNVICLDTRKHTEGDEYRVVSWEHDVVWDKDFDPEADMEEGLSEQAGSIQDWLEYLLEFGPDIE